jgi:hypothetical protein
MVVGSGGGGGVGRATIDAYEVGKIFKSGGLSRAKREEKDLIEWRVGRVKGGFL